MIPVLTAIAHAAEGPTSRGPAILAQQTSEEDTGGESSTGQDTDEGEGSSGAEAETGANEGQTEGGETEETGPPWTYQMARISLALLVLMGLATAGLYWRLVVQRQRRGV
jgi:hypothetical protein